jgi:hypothetical protein
VKQNTKRGNVMRTKRTIENLGSLNKKAAAKFEPFLVAADSAMAA